MNGRRPLAEGWTDRTGGRKYVQLGPSQWAGGPGDKVLPAVQSSLDNAVERSNAKVLRGLAIRARLESNHKNRALSWKYDEHELRASLSAGAVSVDETILYHDFMAWLNDASIITLRDVTTGETVRKLSPKRGNIAYARKYVKRLSGLQAGLEGLSFDEPLSVGRDKYRRCMAFLITVTYDHTKISCQEAWHNVSDDLTVFKIMAKRALGAGMIQSIAVKEGSESGYPAPHIFMIIDRPLTCFKWAGKKSHVVTYRLQSRETLTDLQNAWKRGYIDVQAVVGGQVGDKGHKRKLCHYLFKYLTKAVKPDAVNPSPDEPNAVDDFGLGLKTFAWQKLFRLRPLHISAGFKALVNHAVRLDTALSESQQPLNSVWRFDSSQRCKLSEYLVILSAPPPPDRVAWPRMGPCLRDESGRVVISPPVAGGRDWLKVVGG